MIRRALTTALAITAMGILAERLGRWLHDRHA